MSVRVYNIKLVNFSNNVYAAIKSSEYLSFLANQTRFDTNMRHPSETPPKRLGNIQNWWGEASREAGVRGATPKRKIVLALPQQNSMFWIILTIQITHRQMDTR